ncbi:RNase H domain-containing protein [Trichonephila clavipes]|nr:RNase H domain-containing protein [Trichonephila clavipes]
MTLKKRNSDTCSVFRSELIVINVGLGAIMANDCDFSELWILSDRRSALQYISGWSSANYETSVSILVNRERSLRPTMSTSPQWILSHVYIRGNEIDDRLFKEGSENGTAIDTSLTYQELYSNARSKLNLIWPIPPTYQRYTGTSPGSLLEMKCDRGFQTTLSGVTSDHLKCLSLCRKIPPPPYS